MNKYIPVIKGGWEDPEYCVVPIHNYRLKNASPLPRWAPVIVVKEEIIPRIKKD